MSKILLVDDEQDLLKQISDWLKRENYLIEATTKGTEALAMLRAYDYDVIILDWMLPGVSGVDLCKSYRSAGGKSPVMLMTVKSTEEDKESGLDCGADDYLVKPFGLRELSARIRALLRRAGDRQASNVLHCAEIELHPAARRVTRNGREIHLEPREFSLLEFFMRHPNQVFDADALIARVWNSDSLISPDSLRTYIKNLRRKLANQSIISTMRGSGYRFEG
ncbi:MAG TPA: response regulator transcription factor [Candidatus Obscuribacterales bacterium]